MRARAERAQSFMIAELNKLRTWLGEDAAVSEAIAQVNEAMGEGWKN